MRRWKSAKKSRIAFWRSVSGAAGWALAAPVLGAALLCAPRDPIFDAVPEVVLDDVTTGEGDRFIYVQARIEVDGTSLTPEIRAYEDQALPVAEPVVRRGVVDDVIVAISLLFPDGETVEVSVFVRPLVSLVWLGAALMALAGLAALAGRAGAVEGRRPPATAGQPAEGTTTGNAAP